ncbi:AraC family transcriptional regulator [Alkanindiges hydrocarboniclasticus]|uniref:AraC family transcriptional regulator n=1 Tax=Alkanindiges hydrocarboniclasticus TaxID=1907941 RepID=A0A1S8CV18_9GAMM|nr:AraC family transcriptional regulator [Alkanindiges hydrocarboniclasticus]ONG40519.1 AraC family transcriptional regulator [Alkanindiges hydrocarboniclasticus]
MEKNTVSSYFVRSALQPIQSKNYDIKAILLECQIDPALIEVPQSRVSAMQFSALWLAVAWHLDDEFFGQDSHGMKVGSFALLCQSLIHCKTLKSALRYMLRFFNLLLDDYHCTLVTQGQYSQIQITEQHGLAGTRQPPRIFGHETLLILQHGIACWLVGRRIPVVFAGFAYPEPAYSEEYHRMYSSELRFNQAFTSLNFDASYLGLPLIQNERTVADFIRQAPANIVLKYKNHSSFSASIRKTLRTLTCSEWPDFDAFAAHLNMTRSTLRRRLKDEGQPFQTIKDQLRRDLAMTALAQSDKTVGEISIELGFAEPSAFHRAFKKWMDCTPEHYRQGLRKAASTRIGQ